MIPHHSNPSKQNRTAHAPYNFVPLPEQVVRVCKIPGHDKYAEHTHTGYLNCVLTTLTPTYTRTALNPEFFARWNENDDKQEMMRDKQARETYAQFFSLDDAQRPIIPGSSLRGMTRALIEIAGFGKTAWVSKDFGITFRAVAAAKDDPLKAPYDQVLGRFGKKVRAGYLLNKSEDWFVQPAFLPSDYGWQVQDAYLKIKDRQLSANAVPGFMSFNDHSYKPQYHEVNFDARVGFSKLGNYVAIITIGTIGSNYPYNGVLVCSGNMLETGKAGQPSPRTHYAIVLSPNPKAKTIKIRRQSIEDYIKGLTPFQKEPPFNSQMGCLIDGRPVFYVEDRGEVVAFGHSPNFRIPYWPNQMMKAATPLCLVPENLRPQVDKQSSDINRIIDISEAIFGFLAEGKQAKGCAGRVFFTDAICEPNQGNIWLHNSIITPKILGSPKPTTFQHYLVQDKDKNHDPDDKRQLAHYGTPTPEETVIRGHKLYWHKQDNLDADDFIEKEEPRWDSDTQHTQIKPVASGKKFIFKVYFENLRDFELGALLWVLDLPKGHHHKIGMGKPLGLGSVVIEPDLVLTDRTSRYSQLLGNNGWHTGERSEPNLSQFKDAFERYILDSDHLGQQEPSIAENLSQVPRIKMLLKMLQWPGPEPSITEYMRIEPNEYKERPVLPDALNLHGVTSEEHPNDQNVSQPNSMLKKNIISDYRGAKGGGLNSPKQANSPGLIWLNDLARAKGIDIENLTSSSNMLAEGWEKIEDLTLKEDVLKEIKSIYMKKGWWDNAPAKNTRKIIQNYYKAWENEKG
jgi:CRISPR-associated protein (TIGR03986 family)